MSTITSAAAMTVTATVTATVTTTAQMTTLPTILPYMENPTSMLSTAGLFLAIVGIQIMAIVGFSGLTLVPILSSVGNALGCGLSHYLWFTDYSFEAKEKASVWADLGWLLQEITLPFYSFLIVRKILSGKERALFHAVFYFVTFAIFCLRIAMIPSRVQNFKIINKTGVVSDPTIQARLNGLTVTYFACIAFNESWCAFFLIRKFHQAQARREALQSGQKSIMLYKKLALSTEIRLVFLAVIGVARAISFSYQTNAPAANTIPGQIDRFVSVFEALLPVVFYVDMLASKVAYRDRYEPGIGGGHKSQSFLYKSGGSSQRAHFLAKPAGMGASGSVVVESNMVKLNDYEMEPVHMRSAP